MLPRSLPHPPPTRLCTHPPTLPPNPSPTPPAADQVFVAGGGNGKTWFDSALVYDRRGGGPWTPVAPLHEARGSLAAAVAGGRAHVLGGGQPESQSAVVEW